MSRDRSFHQLVIASAIGGGLELFDFVVYVYFAKEIAANFFSTCINYDPLLLTFSVFAIGYFSRPLGGLLFGHFGDRFGRKKALIVSLLFMVAPTICIGLLPPDSLIGLVAPWILIVLRFLQGLGLGGELPGSFVYISEISPRGTKGLYTGWVYFGVHLGIVVASVIASFIIGFFPEKDVVSFGWRIPFILGGAVAFVGYYIRSRAKMSPEFCQLISENKVKKHPLKELITKDFLGILIGVGASALGAACVGLVILFMPRFFVDIGILESSAALFVSSVNVILLCALTPLMGRFSDLYGRKKVLLTGSIGLFLLGIPIYYLLACQSCSSLLVLMPLLAILAAAVIGPVPASLTEIYKKDVRYTGVALSYSISFALFCGTVPLLGSFVITYFNDATLLGIYLSTVALITTLCVLSTKRLSKAIAVDVGLGEFKNSESDRSDLNE